MSKKLAMVLLVVVILVIGIVAPVSAQTLTNETTPPAQGDTIAQMAQAVGMTREEFLQELLSGKTTQEVLEENGVTRQSLTMMQQEKDRPVAERIAITALTELLSMTRGEFYQALTDGNTINALLDAQGVTHEDFIAAYRVTATEQINQALADGKIDEEQAQNLLDKLDEADFGEQWLVNLDRKQMEQLSKCIKNFANAENIAPILGMDVEELRHALRDGSTLAEVIADAGMDEQDILDQLIDNAITGVQAAIDEGKITTEQGERLLERMQEEDFGEVAWDRTLSESFSPRDVAARKVLQQMHELVEKFHNTFGR